MVERGGYAKTQPIASTRMAIRAAMPPTMDAVPMTFSTDERMRWLGFMFFELICSIVIVGFFMLVTSCISLHTV